MSKINFYWNELYDECVDRFNQSYEISLDTRDYVPLDHIEEDQKILLKRRKKVLRFINREDRRFRRSLGKERRRYYESLAEQRYLDMLLEYYAKSKSKSIIVDGEVVDVPEDNTVADDKSLETAKAEQPTENADVPGEKSKGEESDVRAKEV